MKMLASHPDYPAFNELWTLWAIAKNPCLLIVENDRAIVEEMDLQELFDDMQDLLDGLPVVFLAGLARVE